MSVLLLKNGQKNSQNCRNNEKNFERKNLQVWGGANSKQQKCDNSVHVILKSPSLAAVSQPCDVYMRRYAALKKCQSSLGFLFTLFKLKQKSSFFQGDSRTNVVQSRILGLHCWQVQKDYLFVI